MNQKLIAQGAEAKLYLQGDKVIKHRTAKTYRHPVLDKKIRKSRTKSEAKLIEKAGKLTNIPKLINQDKFKINIKHIKGDRLSETLNTYPEKHQIKLMQQLGRQVAKLHSNNIIHGDLTTSNTILQKNPTKLFIIDFGLGFISSRLEDMAVDLHLIKQALEAKHFQNFEKLFQNFISEYNWQNSGKVLNQLKKVESRGRYKGH
jgi:Kae1-associated kinase Bud32